MRASQGGSVGGTREIDGQISQNTDAADKYVRPVTRINGQRIHFRDLAIMAFPNKTEANLAFFARVDARTARRWLTPDDKNTPPADVLGLLLAEIMTRYHQRD
jgi:hypothetical protein